VALTGLLLSYAVGGGILLVVLLDIGIVFRALGWILLYLLLAALIDSAGLVLGDRWFGTRYLPDFLMHAHRKDGKIISAIEHRRC
jgi:hypothetical protein